MKPTFEQVAALFCKGEAPPNWVIKKLRQNAELVGYLIKPTDDRSIQPRLFESALHLQELLPLYPTQRWCHYTCRNEFRNAESQAARKLWRESGKPTLEMIEQNSEH